jgi:hypothetical protein
MFADKAKTGGANVYSCRGYTDRFRFRQNARNFRTYPIPAKPKS